MKSIFSSLLLILIVNIGIAQTTLYSKAYGSNKNETIIFLHGGPGYNSVSFQYSTAQKLADNGFYVIVYDQRGSGRTEIDTTSKYDFNEAFEDLNAIYHKYNIKKATLIGHSFGGTLAIKFSEKFPEKVENLILTGSPLSYQLTFKSIIVKCKKIYTETQSTQLAYIDMLEKMDTNLLAYSSYCFMHAMSNGFYITKNKASEAIAISDSLKKCADAKYLSNMTREPVNGFYEKEHYTTLSFSNNLREIKKQVKVFGIYGAEDGLFDTTHLDALKAIIGDNNFVLVQNASHNVFIDQQSEFINKVKQFILQDK